MGSLLLAEDRVLSYAAGKDGWICVSLQLSCVRLFWLHSVEGEQPRRRCDRIRAGGHILL
jgi:hypothetical protein